MTLTRAGKRCWRPSCNGSMFWQETVLESLDVDCGYVCVQCGAGDKPVLADATVPLRDRAVARPRRRRQEQGEQAMTSSAPTLPLSLKKLQAFIAKQAHVDRAHLFPDPQCIGCISEMLDRNERKDYRP